MGYASQQWQRRSVFWSLNNDNYDSQFTQRNLELSCKDSSDFVRRLGLMRKLNVHEGCVNSLHWNSTGEYLLSGSDDQYIAITNPHVDRVLLKYKTAHNVNIFSCRFMPHTNDHAIVSCSGDGVVLHTEFLAPYARRFTTTASLNFVPRERNENDVKENFFSCHKTGTAYDVLPLTNEPRCFLSCGEDGTVRFYDLRCMSRCNDRHCRRNMLVISPSAVNAMDVAPINYQTLAIGCADSIVRIYDRRKLAVMDSVGMVINEQTMPLKSYPIPTPSERRLYRTTCVKFSPDESELLVSYSSDYLYLYDMRHEGFDAVKLFASGRYMSKSSRHHRCHGSGGSTGGSIRSGPRLRLRGDWSDTGPNARPEAEARERLEIGQVRPPLQANVMGRIADVISRMLSDPSMRMGLASMDTEPPILALSPEAIRASTSRAIPLPPPPSHPLPRRTGQSSSRWRRAIRHTIGELATDSSLSGLDEAASRTSTVVYPSLPTTSRGMFVAMPANAADMTVSATPARPAGSASLKRPMVDPGDGSVAISRRLDNMNVPMDIEVTSEGACALMKSVRERTAENDHSYVRMKFFGHRNSRTMIKSACFWGNRYVMSGSDCGHIFVWERDTGKLVKLLEADFHVVNRVVPHPHLPYLISSGIDYDIKLWAPVDHNGGFNQDAANIIMRRNAVMLQETMDTITVPAPMLIRLLTGIHSLRNRNRDLFMRHALTEGTANPTNNGSATNANAANANAANAGAGAQANAAAGAEANAGAGAAAGTDDVAGAGAADVNAGAHVDADANANAVVDADADADANSNADVDADSNGDVDADSNGDVDADSNGDVDADSNGDVDADSSGDGDSNADADTEADSDVEIESEADDDADADSDGDVEIESEADDDADADGDIEIISAAYDEDDSIDDNDGDDTDADVEIDSVPDTETETDEDDDL